MLDLVAGRPRFRLWNRGKGYGSMMQDVRATTADGYRQVDNEGAFVIGCTTCWKPATAGRDCQMVLKARCG